MTSRPAVVHPTAVIPGGVPGLGHLPALVADPLKFLRHVRGYGDLVVIRVGPLPVYVLNAPELVHRVLVTDGTDFDKGRLFERAGPVLGDGLLASDGDHHLRQRRLLQPAFHRRHIPSWAKATEAESVAMCAQWRPGDAVDVVTWTRTLATRIVLRTLFRAEPSDRVVARVDRALPVLLRGFIPRLLRPDGFVGRVPTPGSVRFDRAARDLRGTLGEIIASHRTAAPGTEPPGSSRAGETETGGTGILPLMCGLGPGTHHELPDKQIQDEAVTMLLAGVETTAASLAWLLHDISQHPDVRSRLRQETDAAGNTAAATRQQAPYFHNVLKENLRLHTPTWILTRRARHPFHYGHVHVPAGAEILFSPLAMHTDPRLYPDPQRFDPDRWTRTAAPPPGAFTPFGAGVHKCIGEHLAWTETAVACSVIVSSWDLTTVSRSPRASKYLGTHQPRRLLMTAVPRCR
ncbi:cytochrome P450 [Streptomyces albospinus]|uniref:Cytochrome P450 n=1 Tax=Streptomyces albospinus TaxID=285515 RepID=A0ABQ2VPG4_9ACTN|nr:cytochrome P450 [Streptomyces albospinus]GGV02308.1 cytochrome P450 [Streptomyces albospinus]